MFRNHSPFHHPHSLATHKTGDRHCKSRTIFPPGNIDKVGDDGRRRWACASAASFEKEPSDVIAFSNHGIHRACDMSERVGNRNKTRMNALEQSIRSGIGQADQPDAEAKSLCMGDISSHYVTDSRYCYRVEIEPCAKSEGCED